MAETSLETLPQDLQMKILSLLPLKSLMSWVLVSKKWASLIRGKKFRDEYLLRSMTKPQMLLIDYPFRRSALSLGLHSLIRPRPSGPHTALFHSVYQEEKPLLFMDRNLKLKANEDDLLFHSVYQQEKPLLSSGQQTMRISLDPDNEISKPIRGLISIREKTKVEICNPGIEKRLPLPVIQAPEGAVIRTYFGYDDVDDVFKVLCVMQMKSNANEYQVLTVRSSEESWTKITCEHGHTRVTEGLCKGGALYYGAWSNSDESLVVSFNVHTQKFNVTKLPEEVNINVFWKLVNYNGGIALVNDADSDLHKNGNLQLWVRKDTNEGDWEKTPIIEINGWN